MYLAISLNGKIARANGSVDWLESIPNPDSNDYGYYKFMESIDTTIMGFSTYKQVINWGIEFPYKDTENFVLSRKENLENTDDVIFISKDHIGNLKALKEKKGKDIWLIGGGQINTFLLNHQLVDEITIHIMPIIIPDGIELFESIPKETMLELVNTISYQSGVVELKYKVANQASN